MRNVSIVESRFTAGMPGSGGEGRRAESVDRPRGNTDIDHAEIGLRELAQEYPQIRRGFWFGFPEFQMMVSTILESASQSTCGTHGYADSNDVMVPGTLASGTKTADERTYWALISTLRLHSPPMASSSRVRQRSTQSKGTFEMMAFGDHPPGLCDTLLSFMSIRELMLLAKVSSSTRAAVLRYTTRAWDGSTFLRYWFPHAEGFRTKLAETGAIVTGSQMIRFFDRLPPLKDSDLDVLTRIGGLLPLAMYLEREGYVRVYRKPRVGRDDDYPLITEVFGVTSSPSFQRGGGKSGIIHVMDFEKDCCHESKGKLLKVQVVVVAKPPIEHLLGFHSSQSSSLVTVYDLTTSQLAL